MKNLARLADERWASKPSFLDKPQTQQQNPILRNSQAAKNTTADNAAPTQNTSAPAEPTPTPQPEPTPEPKTKKPENPWDKAVNPGDSWQPESWTPTSRR
jgi:NADH dehydrogenase [ubiquinone] 1 alpha subcomplex assembly factor 2